MVANCIHIYSGAIPGGKIPIEILKNIPIPGRLWSMGDPEVLRGSIGMSNSLFNKAEQQAEMALNKPMFINSTINIDEIETGAGAINEIRGNARDAVSYMDIPDITQGVQFMLNYIQNGIIQTAGINYNVLNESSGQTAFGLALQQEQTLARLGLFVKYNEPKIRNLCRMAFTLLQKFYSKEKARLILDENGKFSVKEKLPKIRVKGKRAVLSKKNGKEYVSIEEAEDDRYDTFEVRPEYIQGRVFDLEMISGSMMSDMVLVKTEKMNRMLQQLAINPKWMDMLKEDVPKNIIENSGESPSKWLKDVVSNATPDGLSELEKEWVSLTNDQDDSLPIDQIVTAGLNHLEYIRFLRRRLLKAVDPDNALFTISAKSKNRVIKAIDRHIRFVENPIAVDKMLQEKELAQQQMQQEKPIIKAPQTLSQTGGADLQGTESRKIRQQASALSQGLNPQQQSSNK